MNKLYICSDLNFAIGSESIQYKWAIFTLDSAIKHSMYSVYDGIYYQIDIIETDIIETDISYRFCRIVSRITKKQLIKLSNILY